MAHSDGSRNAGRDGGHAPGHDPGQTHDLSQASDPGQTHGHGHGHDHAPAVTADNQRRVFWAMLITAGHMLTDSASLLLAFVAFRLGRKPADARRSYGYERFQVLAAFVNGATLLAIVVWIAVEALRRLMEPQPVMGGTMLAVAAAGLVVNLVAFRLLHGGDQGNLNLRGAALHVLGDLLGSVAAIAAGATILLTGWTPIDPILSLLVAALVARSAWHLLRQSGHILLEGTPGHLDIGEIAATVQREVPEVTDVHHVHAWALVAERPLVTLHAGIRPDADPARALDAVKRVLAERFQVTHSTVQLEPAGCADARLPDGCGAPRQPAQ
jgi:cobalt-zinc-cadmium efflux system protein